MSWSTRGFYWVSQGGDNPTLKAAIAGLISRGGLTDVPRRQIGGASSPDFDPELVFLPGTSTAPSGMSASCTFYAKLLTPAAGSR